MLANEWDMDELIAAGFDEKELGVFTADEAGAPELKDGDRAPFRQATFTLHDEQWEEVEAALAKAKKDGGGESAVNENSNGNAMAWICRRFNRG
jgi:ParB family chromosome partitioning protein